MSFVSSNNGLTSTHSPLLSPSCCNLLSSAPWLCWQCLRWPASRWRHGQCALQKPTASNTAVLPRTSLPRPPTVRIRQPSTTVLPRRTAVSVSLAAFEDGAAVPITLFLLWLDVCVHSEPPPPPPPALTCPSGQTCTSGMLDSGNNQTLGPVYLCWRCVDGHDILL